MEEVLFAKLRVFGRLARRKVERRPAMSIAASGLRRNDALISMACVDSGCSLTWRSVSISSREVVTQRGACRGEHAHVRLLLTVGASHQDHGHARAEALGHREPAGFADDEIAGVHKRRHLLDVVEHRHRVEVVVGHRPAQMERVLLVASRDDHEVDPLERVQVGNELVERFPEMHVGPRQLGPASASTTRLSSGSPNARLTSPRS